MLTAVYYPHTRIRDMSLLKNALLLWDRVEYIVPFQKWEHETLNKKAYDEAIELIAEPHLPTDDEKAQLHGRVEALVKRGVPDWFFLRPAQGFHGPERYKMYTDKMAQETVDLLIHHGMARVMKNHLNYAEFMPATGLIVMSLLADVCAGKSKQKITDRPDAYRWLAMCDTEEMGGEYKIGKETVQLRDDIERLVSVSIKVLDTDDIPISKLIAMRKREAKSAGSDYRAFRLKYLTKIDEFVRRLREPDVRESDVKEIEREFQKGLDGYISNLNTELGLALTKLIFSKEVAVAVLAAVGTLTAPILGLVGASTSIGIGALVKDVVDYRAARRKALRENPMSWLYLSKSRIGW